MEINCMKCDRVESKVNGKNIHIWMNITTYLFYIIKAIKSYCAIPTGN
jgi:hypothetical protein